MHGTACSLPPTIANRRAMLVVAHPGHELRVHGWLEQARPTVWVVTDGSGHGDQGRLHSTARLLERAGCSPGPMFGRLTDRAAYALITERDVEGTAALVGELAAAIRADGIDYIAGDACEGFNPVHDLCRLLIDSAVLVAGGGGRTVDSYEFPLEAGPSWNGGGEELCWRLDDTALERKLSAARSYPELASEVENALELRGEAAFRTERFHRAEPLATLRGRLAAKPRYELFGEERVAAGHYQQVLRHSEHFAPLMAALLARCGLAAVSA